MKFGEIYSYRNAKEAKKYIGKKGMFSDSLRDILDLPAACDVLILMEIKEGETYPFYGEPEEEVFQFFRPVLEEEEIKGNLGKTSPEGEEYDRKGFYRTGKENSR